MPQRVLLDLRAALPADWKVYPGIRLVTIEGLPTCYDFTYTPKRGLVQFRVSGSVVASGKDAKHLAIEAITHHKELTMGKIPCRTPGEVVHAVGLCGLLAEVTSLTSMHNVYQLHTRTEAVSRFADARADLLSAIERAIDRLGKDGADLDVAERLRANAVILFGLDAL